MKTTLLGLHGADVPDHNREAIVNRCYCAAQAIKLK